MCHSSPLAMAQHPLLYFNSFLSEMRVQIPRFRSGQVIVPWHVEEMYITTLAASRDSVPPERRRMTNKGLFGRQLPDDSTLENMRKSGLIELLHIAEHNHSVLVEAYNNVVTNSRCNSCLLVENNRQLREKLAAGA